MFVNNTLVLTLVKVDNELICIHEIYVYCLHDWCVFKGTEHITRYRRYYRQLNIEDNIDS